MPRMSELAIKAKELNYFSRKFWGRVKDYIDNQELKNVPVGTILAVAGDKIPEGFLPCNGASISRSTYQRLFEVIDTKYGIGNGSTTFNLPNLTNRFIQGSNFAGTVKSAGLPNIIGSFGYFLTNSSGTQIVSGAIIGSSSSAISASGNGSGFKITSFDASKSNATYGNSNTVQPPALTARFIIKY